MNLRNIPNNSAFINNTSLLCLQDIDLLTEDEKEDINNLLKDKLNKNKNKLNSNIISSSSTFLNKNNINGNDCDDDNDDDKININDLNRQIDNKLLLGNVHGLTTIATIAQISTLALFANDILSNLILETNIANDRIIHLNTKLIILKDRINNTDVEINLYNNHISKHVIIDNQLIWPSSLPLSIIQQYKLINKVLLVV